MAESLNEHSFAAAPAATGSAELGCVVALAGHAWRLSRLTRRAVEKVAPTEGGRLQSQLRYVDRQIQDELSRLGIRIVDLEGQRFDSGMAASALNATDFQPTDDLRVSQTIEPAIVGPTGLLKYGVVMLEKIQT